MGVLGMERETMEEGCGLAVPADSGARDKKAARSPARRFASLLWSGFLLMFFIGAGLQIGGFARYVVMVTKPPAAITAPVDGIVVLTGGENRIETAMALLAGGKSQRMLITGVNPNLSLAALQRQFAPDSSLFDCCIDIDRQAHDTIGNALAARNWAEKYAARSLIVVTGAFHMPRALKELSHAIENVELIAVPVNVPTDDKWWHNASRLRDLLREYIKLVAIHLRDYLNAMTGETWPTMPMRNKLNDAALVHDGLK